MLSYLIISMMMFFMSSFFLMLSIYIFLFKSIIILEWDIYFFSSMKYSLILYFDFMSLMFLWGVLFITSIVLIYSMDYMNHDKYISRFKFLILLFLISMSLMIISPNMLTILVGWDGLGLISYCLVIYYQSFNAYNSGMITILCNRIGDIGLLMLICLSISIGSWNLMLYYFNDKIFFLMLIFCIFTKSAQMPFSIWLPMAMTAPTPVSSLVHSSTLVTAGVYLMLRHNKILMFDNLNLFILYISIFTMLMAGINANFEFDFKKIIALSTLSQLGFMISLISMGFCEMGFFHLIIHALFKSTMFLSAGKYIHFNMSNQDIRYFGVTYLLSPLTMFILFLTLMNLCGFPFMSGFYSKDLIIEFFLSMKFNVFLLLMFYMSMIMTISYSFRMLLWLFNNSQNNYYYLTISSDKFMNFCLFVMFLSVLFMGGMILFIYFKLYVIVVSLFDKLMILKMYLFGLYTGFYCYKNFSNFNSEFMMFFKSMYYLSYLFKNNYKKIILSFYNYELIMEKGYNEIFLGMYTYKLINWFNYVYYYKNLLMLLMFYLIIIINFLFLI